MLVFADSFISRPIYEMFMFSYQIFRYLLLCCMIPCGLLTLDTLIAKAFRPCDNTMAFLSLITPYDPLPLFLIMTKCVSSTCSMYSVNCELDPGVKHCLHQSVDLHPSIFQRSLYIFKIFLSSRYSLEVLKFFFVPCNLSFQPFTSNFLWCCL